jgi:cellulose synthase/poly-beta-1,6-N-acetylglucosamine synthase-like glycosyltransferase
MIIDIFLVTAASLLSIPVVVLFVQVVFACLPKTRCIVIPTTNVRIAILVPAHNEAEGIIATINSIRPQLNPGDRLLIVADNCTDKTATVAVENGAEAIERHDLSNRGKGYALDFGIKFLAQNPPHIVVIVDADCIVQENALQKLATYSAHHNKPVQSLYLMLSPNGASLKSKIAEFAWTVKNLVRARGYAKLGLPCPLMGSGMAFPWAVIAQANLANGNIVEDLKLGIDLCKSGNAPLYYEDALVTSYFPNTAEGQAVQRTRWEHGHLSMILSQAPQLFLQGILQGNKKLLAMGLDLCVPPLALLVVMLMSFWIIAGLASLAGSGSIALLISTSSILQLIVAILLAWRGWGRHIIPVTTLLLVPVYVLSKIPHYFSFIFKRQKKWIRTDRK